MAKEVLTLNDFSGGVNTHSFDRDVKTPGKDPSEAQSVLSSFLNLGDSDKGGEFVQLYNVEVDVDGVLRVSGGTHQNHVATYGQNRFPDGLIQGGGLFSYPTDNTLNYLNHGILNSNKYSNWTLGSGVSLVSSDTITLSDGTSTKDISPSSANSDRFIKMTQTASQYGASAVPMNSIELNLDSSKEKVPIKAGKTYTLRFKMTSNQPYIETAGVYPPSIKIYNDNNVFDTDGDGNYDSPIYNTIQGWGTDSSATANDATAHNSNDGKSLLTLESVDNDFVGTADITVSSGTSTFDISAGNATAAVVQGEGMPTYWLKNRTFLAAVEGTDTAGGSGAAILLNEGSDLDADDSAPVLDDGTNASADNEVQHWIARAEGGGVGDIIKIDDEEMAFISKSSGTFNVIRGYNGTTAAAHTNNKPVSKLANRTNALKITISDDTSPDAVWFGTSNYLDGNFSAGENYQIMFYYRTDRNVGTGSYTANAYNPVFTLNEYDGSSWSETLRKVLPNTTIGDGGEDTTGSKIALSNNNASVSGTVKGTLAAHGLKTGDVIYIEESPTFRGNQVVTVIDDSNFYFTHPGFARAGTQTVVKQDDGSNNNLVNMAGHFGAGATALTVDDGQTFQPGDVIQMGSEDVYVYSISGNVLTVVRDWNGTTDAQQNDDSTIEYQDAYAVAHVWRPATFTLSNPNRKRGWIQHRLSGDTTKIKSGFTLAKDPDGDKYIHVSHFDIYKASGVDLETLAFNNDELTSPFEEEFIGDWQEYEYTFTIPHNVESGSKNNPIPGWRIKIDGGYVVDPAYNNVDVAAVGKKSTHNLYIDDVRLTSDENDFVYLFSRNTTSVSDLIALSPNTFGAENIVRYTGLDADFQTYIANGRVFICDSNYSNKDNRPYQFQYVNSDRNLESIGAGTSTYWKKGIHTNEGPTLLGTTSKSGGIDYDNVVKLIDNGLMNSDIIDRRTYARVMKKYESAFGWNPNSSRPFGPNGYDGTASSGNYQGDGKYGVMTDSSGASTTAVQYKADDAFGKMYTGNHDCKQVLYNWGSNRLDWHDEEPYSDNGRWFQKREHLYTFKGYDTSDTLDLDSKLNNDVALIEWEIEDFFMGKKMSERMMDTENGSPGNVIPNWELDIYAFGTTEIDTSDVDGVSYTSPGTLATPDNAWNGLVFTTVGDVAEAMSTINGSPIFSWNSNPSNKQYHEIYTMHGGMSDRVDVIDDEYGHFTAKYNGSASFPLGQINKRNTIGVKLLTDCSSLLNIGGASYTPNEWQNSATRNVTNGSQYLHGGVAMVTLKKLHVYGYTNGYSATDLPTANQVSGGTLINLNFTGTAGSGWNKTWDVALTTVNIHGEESAFSNIEEGVSGGTSTQQLEMSVYMTQSIPNDKYLKKIKVYMKSSTLDIFYLQAEIDLGTMKIKSSTSGKEFPGLYISDKGYYSFTFPKDYGLQPNLIDSYESQTTIPQKVAFNSENMYCKFKTATICNNRVYVGNVEQNGRIYSDRMIKSPVNQFGILPSSSFIDVAINDGDEITHLESFKDSLMQFKKRKVFIINVSEGYEYLEETLDNVGVEHSSQVCKTPKGIAWITENGCYIWDGKELTNLIENKLTTETFSDAACKWQIISDDIPQIGYLKEADKLIILKSSKPYTSTSSEGRYLEGYIYDFRNQAWTMTFNRTHAHGEKSNFIHHTDGSLVWNNSSAAGNNIAKFYKWSNDPISTYNMPGDLSTLDNINHLKQFRIVTKDFTFEEPSVRKKIYKVYVTYKSVDNVGQTTEAAANSNVLLYYATNGQGEVNGTTNWTEFPESKEASASTVLYKTSSEDAGSAGFQGTSTWKTVELKPSSSINNIYSFQLKFELDKQSSYKDSNNSKVANGFMINDISIVYRKKSIK